MSRVERNAARHDVSGGETLAKPLGMRLRLLLLLIAAGCDFSPVAETDVTLAAFSMFHIDVSEQSFAIALGERDPRGQASPCPVVDANLSARLNGVSVPLVKRGGKIGEEPGDDVSENDCGAPLLQLDMPPPDGPSLLEISDPAARLTCNLPDLKAARQATLVPAVSGTWEWRAGQEVTVQWSPSGDLQMWSSFYVALSHLTAANTIDGGTGIGPAPPDGDVMRFTVPPVPPGAYLLEAGPLWNTVTCGPSRVTATISSSVREFGVRQPVMIVP